MPEKNRRLKLLILNPNIPPRAIKIFNIINQNSDIELKVFFYQISAKNRRWNLDPKELKFDYQILKSFDIQWSGKDLLAFNIAWDFWPNLRHFDPDVIVVPGWADMSSYMALIYAKLFGKKVILRSESTTYERSWQREMFKPLTKLAIFLSSSYLACGSRAKEYLVSLGAVSSKVIVGYSTIDVPNFIKASKISDQKRQQLRNKNNIDKNSVLILFNGQLIERKGVYDLLAAFEKLNTQFDNLELMMIGYGQELDKIKRKITLSGLEDKIHLPGYINNQDLPLYYGISDIFVLPSTEETWGIVVNEAMASKLPVVVGDRVGSSQDLVHSNTGLVFKSGDINSLVESLSQLISDKSLRSRMGHNAQVFISKYDLKYLARKIIEAARL